MHNFMIGQYGTFDYQKYRRDFKPGFYGIEACLFDNEEDVRTLVSESINKGFKVGIHFPLRSGRAKLRDALFLSTDENTRLHALQLIEQELQFLVKVRPEYVLFHYPKPVILDDNVNWELWRFSDCSEYVYESEYSLDEFMRQSEQLFQWLTVQAEKYKFIPVLEFDALNKYVYQETFLKELLNKYPKIRLCLDTGRLHLQDRIDPNFDAKHVIRKFGKFAHTLHLWNIQITESISNHHLPVLPEQKAEDGWAPIQDYLETIKKVNKNVKVMFEHRSDKINDEDLERCYRWVYQMINGDDEDGEKAPV